MKRWIAVLAIGMLLCTALPAAGAEGSGSINRLDTSPYGMALEYGRIEGWTVSLGYLDGRYCLIGRKDGTDVRVALTDDAPDYFIPAGDRVIYFSAEDSGWMLRDPDAKNAERLVLEDELFYESDIFYADAQSIWYVTYGEAIYRYDRAAERKEKILPLECDLVTLMDDGSLLLCDFAKREVQLFQDGKTNVIYKADEEITMVFSVGGSVWVELEGRYGMVADGELVGVSRGSIKGYASSSKQQVLLVEPVPGAATYDVVILNDAYRAVAHVGTVPSSEEARMELTADSVIVWEEGQGVVLPIPVAEAWVPFGKSPEQPKGELQKGEVSKGELQKGESPKGEVPKPEDFSAPQMQIGEFSIRMALEQLVARQPIPLGELVLEASVWEAKEDAEVSIVVFDAGPLLTDDMRAEIKRTGTLQHAQLIAFDAMEIPGLDDDSDSEPIGTTYVQDIPALVLSDPERTSYLLALCQGEGMILLGWPSNTEIDMLAAIGYDAEALEPIPADVPEEEGEDAPEKESVPDTGIKSA